jgi:hypothetical protein
MKIPLFTIALALCLASLGCEMHSEEDENHAGTEPKASAELQKALEPEPANPAPPAFFPSPKPK